MKAKRYRITAVILGICAVACWAGHNAKYSALAGAKGCRVQVQITCHTTDKRFGLTEDILQTEAEAGLVRNGIKVLSHRECEQTAGRPILSVKVFLATREGLKTAAVHTEVNFMEDAELKREPKLSCPAIVWGIRNETLLSVGNLKEGVREVVKNMVDAFCDEYLAANPRAEDPAPNYGNGLFGTGQAEDGRYSNLQFTIDDLRWAIEIFRPPSADSE